MVSAGGSRTALLRRYWTYRSDRQRALRCHPPCLQASTAQNTLEPLRAPTDNKAKDEDMEEERE